MERSWLCHQDKHSRFEAQREQEWLCYRNAWMARRRVTSSVTRCGAEAPQLCSTIPPGLICRRESRIGGDSRRSRGHRLKSAPLKKRLDVV